DPQGRRRGSRPATAPEAAAEGEAPKAPRRRTRKVAATEADAS
ncbi:hypothetical protein GA0115240_164113, partial [Streptomyces sp. DvalAA-14]